jgi:hypothetical protein
MSPPAFGSLDPDRFVVAHEWTFYPTQSQMRLNCVPQPPLPISLLPQSAS